MNPAQEANEALGTVLGVTGRAVWLAVRLDGKSLGQVAKEHSLPVWQIKEILASGDFAASLIRIRYPEATGKYLPNYGGFHAQEDSL